METDNKRKLSDKFIETLIIKGILTKKEYLTLVMNSFEPRYFDNSIYQSIFKNVVNHYKENLTLPNETILKDIVKDSNDNTFKEIKELDFDIENDYKFLVKESNLYLKEKSMKHAIMDSVDVIDEKKDNSLIKEVITKALSKDLILNLGLDYWNTLGERLKRVLEISETKMPFCYPMLDEFTNGGCIPYSLSIFLSRIHGFKCVGKDTIISIKNKHTNEIYDTRIEDFFNCFINKNKEIKKGEIMLNLDGMIKKYGKNKGTEKYNTWKSNISKSSKNRNTLPYFIEKYGEKEGNIRYNNYINKQKFSNSLEGFIEKYGEKEGTKKWEDRIKTGAYNRSLEGFIEKYGEKEGTKKREKITEKWQNTLNSKSDKEKKKINEKKINNLTNMIKRHGKKEGTKKYRIMLEKKFNKNNSVSKPEKELFDIIKSELKGFDVISQKWIEKYSIDIVINDKICIEFYGDYWHCNPLLYESDYYHSIIDMTAKEKWKHDKERLDYIQKCGYKTLIVWENDWNNNKTKIINNIIKYVKENLC